MTNSLQAALNKIKDDNVDEVIVSSPTRDNTVLVGTHVSQEIHKQLRIIAAEESKKQQDLILEAFSLLFAKYGKKKI
jgi:hypothetical protein|tara:strand:+ start:55 stop:285 length:231 start_codon:yes stop_codon:yes gene_type:complete